MANQLGLLGGTEKHLLKILPEIPSSEIEVKVFSFRTGGSIVSHLTRQGVRVIAPEVFRRSIIGSLVSMYGLYRTYWKERPDIVHYYLPESYILGELYLFTFSCKKIMSRRSLQNYQRGKPLIARLEKFLHGGMNRIVANSKAVINDLIEEGVPPEKTRLIYNGVEVIRQFHRREHKRHEEKVNKDSLVFLTVANLIPYKGHSDLFIALEQIKDKLPDSWLLLCAGRDSGIKGDLSKLAIELDIDQNIRFLGSWEDVANLINISDIAVSSAHEEGFSNSILEYMSGGLPVIAYDVGGNAEAIVNDVTGMIVPVRNIKNLGEAILNLIEDDAKRNRFGRAARKRALENFSINFCVAEYVQLYKTVMAEM